MSVQTLPSMQRNKIARLAAFFYGLVCYAIFLFAFLYAFGFVGNFVVPHSIDSAPAISWANALLVDAALLGIFGIQHSVMARKGFKNWWTQFVPKPIERSTYVLFSSLCLIALFHFWQPIGGVIWNITNPMSVLIIYALFASGWLLVLVSTFLINHFDLFGLRQVWLYLQRQEYTHLAFATPGLYKYVRHPLYVGWFLGFWSTPTMTVTHLVFALITTAYILVAIQFEERDLVNIHGQAYADYRRRVPMLVPFTHRRQREQ
ncbi:MULTISPECIES: methanethiol S-methyltransferase [Nostocales]|uniref:methanethiol S-methyltransferase n=3 Tax=Nostocales TaxID=1161 RepID=A0A0C1R1P5_9CYAN|nr:methanethiol S-methyltransferase [Tolypothrix bouteillei]KAF3884632.1 isoprenylcysteine carboxylmethyltransferase family protein [Tolypothrix bouteillei VB521301]